MTRSTPAVVNNGYKFRRGLAPGPHLCDPGGHNIVSSTTVIRAALARGDGVHHDQQFHQVIVDRMTCGLQMKMSRHEHLRSTLAKNSPSGKFVNVILTRGSPSEWQIFSARETFARPLKHFQFVLTIHEYNFGSTICHETKKAHRNSSGGFLVEVLVLSMNPGAA